jgi:hypothetical protein
MTADAVAWMDLCHWSYYTVAAILMADDESVMDLMVDPANEQKIRWHPEH